MTTFNSANINVKGYATPRPFSGFQVPIPLQSMAIRRYCEERGFIFNHHVVENITPNTYLVLERVIEEAHRYQAIAMCSIGLLPTDTEYRQTMLERCLDRGASLHFVFEQVVIASVSDINSLNELFSLVYLCSNAKNQPGNLRQLLQTPR